jgi:hypothetical protein
LADGTLVVVRALPGADTDPSLPRDVAAAVAAAADKAHRSGGST